LQGQLLEPEAEDKNENVEEEPVVAVGGRGVESEECLSEGVEEGGVTVSVVEDLLKEVALVVGELFGVEEYLRVRVGSNSLFVVAGHQLDAEGNELVVFHD
jgi:hypothetical protein